MFTMLWHLSVALRGYLRFHAPTNRAADWLKSPCGLKWAILVAMIATPSYLLAMSVCATLVERGASGFLNLLVLLFTWNAVKFAVAGVVSPVRCLTPLLAARRRADVVSRTEDGLTSPLRAPRR
jgi:hypothetical protein